MKKERWQLRTINRDALFAWCDYFNLPPLETRLLLQREISTQAQAAEFFEIDESRLSDPLKWDGMEKAVNRIHDGLQNNEKICIYGDYDVDGITGTAILKETFRRLGKEVEFYIPDRQEEGYGLNEEALEYLAQNGTQVLVTVDCGTTSVELIKKFENRGMDIIITDHHLPGSVLPDAYSLINPQCSIEYPVDPLAGAGVAYKLAQSICVKEIGKSELISDLIGWAALATVVDMVPLQGENRLIVQIGLKELAKHPSVGLNALMDVSGVAPEAITERDLGFGLGPRLNASGRLQTARQGVELLLETNPERAKELALNLDEVNRERQAVEKEILAEAQKLIRAEIELPEAIVLYQPHWHSGVIGIVASRIAKEFWRPVLLLCGEGDEIKGSGRSIPGFDLHQGLSDCSNWLIQFGGHRQAAGMSLKLSDLAAFREDFCRAASAQLSEEDYLPRREIDGIIGFDEISFSFLERVKKLGPYGLSNPVPRFLFYNLEILSIRTMGAEGQHLKLRLSDGKNEFEALSWNSKIAGSKISIGEFIFGVGEVRKNVWNGRESLEILLDSWGKDSSYIINEFFEVSEPEGSDKISKPTDREHFAKFYRMLAKKGQQQSLISMEEIKQLWEKDQLAVSWQTLGYLLQVFSDLGFLSWISEDHISWNRGLVSKQQLEYSVAYKNELEKVGTGHVS
ncbi:MAG: single-stranded-DNA-specific exonuclease RecJ [Negativicutes bacterium]|nr:single-stranded-DNA-specific exonuclease RecJ [Negativicutes bacterium]